MQQTVDADAQTKDLTDVDAVLERPYHPINLRHYTGNLTEIRPQNDTIYYFKGIGENK